MKRLRKIGIALTAAIAAAAASAQVELPGLPGVPVPLPPVTDPVAGTLRTAQSLPRAELRRLRIRELLKSERGRYETDPAGQPIVKSQVGALSPSAEALARAKEVGFAILSEQALEGLGLRLVVLQAPPGMSTRRALKKLRELDPEGSYDYNHLYLESSGEAPAAKSPAPTATTTAAVAMAAAPATANASAVRIGLVDTGVDAAHPSLAGAAIRSHGCDGKPTPAYHGTAVASILVGNGDGYEGVLPGATLYAADVFCGHGAGSLSLLAVELDWLAREGVPVVNISLVGAKSVLLTALVRAMGERGHLLVAAVGNDGPAAPPLFPAAYPDVIGVTGVDDEDRVLPEACRGEQVDFAARGADFRAAVFGGAYGEVRGTSFATPIVAGLLAAGHPARNRDGARRALEALAQAAADLGRKGPDTTYGKGLVGREFRSGWKKPAP